VLQKVRGQDFYKFSLSYFQSYESKDRLILIFKDHRLISKFLNCALNFLARLSSLRVLKYSLERMDV